MIRLSKDGQNYEFKSYKEALIGTGLYTSPANAQTAINKLTRAGYTLEGADVTTTSPAPAPQPAPAPEPKIITVPAPAPVKVTAPAPAPAPAAATTQQQTNLQAALVDLLKDALPQQNNTAPAVNEETVRQLIREELKNHVGQQITVQVANLPKVTMQRQHQTFKQLLTVCAQRVNVMLIGPAGSGKTTGALKVAEALELPFYAISVGPQTTKTDLIGYNDANGKYNRTPLREAFENGGVFLLDEIDAGNPAVLTVLNATIENQIASFPDGMIQKHPDFIVIAAANTFGTGANRQYVGRQQLDAATLDRFSRMQWNYDEAFELELCSNKQWCKLVQSYRKNADQKGLRVVISPRASIKGATLLAAGIPQKDVEEMLIFAGLDAATVQQIKG